VLHKLRDDGNTIVVIEHNLDVIKTADWVVDLGPEGGHRGGQLLAQGTPEDLAQVAASYTGQFLAKVLPKPKPGAKVTTKPSPATMESRELKQMRAMRAAQAENTAANKARTPAKARSKR
jgi:excinuclease ABC subunit A